MVGAPGTGKSHLARHIAARFGAQLVQTDAVRKELFPTPAYTAAEMRRVYGVAFARLGRLLAAGGTVIFDATNLTERSRASVHAVAMKYDADFVIVVAYAPEEVIRARLEARINERAPDDLSDADWPIFLRMRAGAQPVRRPHIVVNTCVLPERALTILRNTLRSCRSRDSPNAGPC